MGIDYFAPFRWGLGRTPNASNANNVRICNAGNGGALNNNNANNSNGAAPIGGICLIQVPKGKPCVSRKESISCLQMERKGPGTKAPSGVVFLYAPAGPYE